MTSGGRLRTVDGVAAVGTDVRIELPASAGSVRTARNFLSGVLGEWGVAEDLADVAVLLASEVVTNAVLHAGTELTVQVRRRGEGLRVEVLDGSPVRPASRGYDDEAVTGRGMALVDALARSWGVAPEPDGDGKAVWFELGPEDEPVGAAPGYVGVPTTATPTHEVCLQRLPVSLLWATVQHGDALLREAALLALGGAPDAGGGSRWTAPGLDLTPLVEAVRAAVVDGVDSIDLVLHVPEVAAGAATRRLALADEAERLAEEGLLLITPSVPEIRHCRRWVLGEITRQLSDCPPSPWAMPDDDDERLSSSQWRGADHEDLRTATAATIVADDTNHIVYANDAATELLGWRGDDLIGRRLTAIVPPELREAHLAGFTRYHVTGETRILGTPVVVPALHRDGDRIEVELRVTALDGPGRPAFRAELRPLSPPEG